MRIWLLGQIECKQFGIADEFMSKKKIHPFWRFVSIATLGGLRTRVRTQQKLIYLTFDDGPHPEYTPKLLELLRHYQARASFFLVGTECLKNAEIVQQIVEDGHLVGNHSTTHPDMQEMPVILQWREYAAADKILTQVLRRPSSEFSVRPPSGKVTWTSVFYSFMGRRRLYLWSRDSLDGTLDSRKVCDEFENSPVENGDVLLFHDDSSVCIEALKVLLPKWQQNGFRFVA